MRCSYFVSDQKYDHFSIRSNTVLREKQIRRRDFEEEYLQLSRQRKIEIENSLIQKQFIANIGGFGSKQGLSGILQNELE